MNLAYKAGKYSGTMPAVLNAANEIAVEMFLQEQISFLDIPKFIEKACDKHLQDISNSPNLDEILKFDKWARIFVREEIKKNFKYIEAK